MFFKKFKKKFIILTAILLAIYFVSFGFLVGHKFQLWILSPFVESQIAVFMSAGAIAIITGIILIFQSTIDSEQKKKQEVFKKKIDLYSKVVKKMNSIKLSGKVTVEDQSEILSMCSNIALLSNLDTYSEFNTFAMELADEEGNILLIDEVSEMPLSVINIDEPGFKDLFWKYGTFVFLGLWLLTMGLWFARALFAKGSSALKKEEHERDGTKKFRQCVLKVENSIIKKDPALIRKSILEWAEMRWPEDPPRRLVDIGEKEIKLKESLLLMERHRYGEVGVEWNSEMLASQFQKVSQMHPEEGSQKNTKIKELYPESLKENQWN